MMGDINFHHYWLEFLADCFIYILTIEDESNPPMNLWRQMEFWLPDKNCWCMFDIKYICRFPCEDRNVNMWHERWISFKYGIVFKSKSYWTTNLLKVQGKLRMGQWREIFAGLRLTYPDEKFCEKPKSSSKKFKESFLRGEKVNQNSNNQKQSNWHGKAMPEAKFSQSADTVSRLVTSSEPTNNIFKMGQIFGIFRMGFFCHLGFEKSGKILRSFVHFVLSENKFLKKVPLTCYPWMTDLLKWNFPFTLNAV